MKASKYQWQRVWARKYSPFIASIFMMVYFKPEIFFSICKNKLFVPEGKLYAYYFEANEFKALVKKFSQKLLKTDLNTFRKKFEKSFIGYLESARRLNKINYTTLNNQQLIKVLKRIYQETGESNKWQMSAFVATEGLAKEVGEKVGNLPNGQKILQSIATPLRETLIKKARKELLRLALAKRNNTKELKRYAKKYAWLPMYEFCDSPWLLADFEKQLKQIENPAQEIKEIDQERGKSLPLYQKYFSSIKNRSWKKKIEAVHLYVYLKEIRDDYRRRYYYFVLPFWQELGKRLRLPIYDLNHLLLGEIVGLLNGGKINKRTIERRKNKYALTLNNGKLSIFDSQEAEAKAKLVNKSIKSNNSVKGSSACSGKVKARVKIIFHQGEFNKFKKGNILVTPMTHPEFLPIMKRAAAIITDEGGITCHAAIISREMNIPCVIGTKIATRVFKDGDLVEVDANKGIVRKL